MKKLVALLMLSLPVCLMALPLSTQVERATAQALVKNTVHVQVKLAKPVRMSDVMFRRPRSKDVVIRVDYKQTQCTGRLSFTKTHVYVPLSCVQDGKFRAANVQLTFADGSQLHKTAQAVTTYEEVASIRL